MCSVHNALIQQRLNNEESYHHPLRKILLPLPKIRVLATLCFPAIAIVLLLHCDPFFFLFLLLSSWVS